MVEFNKQLITRLQAYWKARTGEDISDATANEYLNSFADLYESFLEFANPKYDAPSTETKRPVLAEL
ncbi:MAG: hypothetical protein WCG27_11070 [Pseudomonadota bacterium]